MATRILEVVARGINVRKRGRMCVVSSAVDPFHFPPVWMEIRQQASTSSCVVKVIGIRLESLKYYTLRFERTKTYGQLAFELLHDISSPAVGPMRTVSMTWFWRFYARCWRDE
eukprot:scaffold49025_cov36-Cyclotella_meneghiniana.AAC.4